MRAAVIGGGASGNAIRAALKRHGVSLRRHAYLTWTPNAAADRHSGGFTGRLRMAGAGYPAAMPPVTLVPDRHAQFPHYGLCVMSGCPRRSTRVVVVQLCGQRREVGMCGVHAVRRAAADHSRA